MNPGQAVNYRSHDRKTFHRMHTSHKKTNWLSRWHIESSPARRGVSRLEPLGVDRTPHCFRVVTEIGEYFVAHLFGTREDDFSSTAQSLQHHRIPPLQI